MICSVCRSQNMETAKFCGNCGNPFPRQSPPSSSFIGCAQGHRYAAVYPNCPYCPQPADAPPSDFATRVAEPITAIEPPKPKVTAPASNDFTTRIDAPSAALDPKPDPKIIFETVIGQAVIPPPPSPIYAPTEVISFQETTIADGPVTDTFATAPPTGIQAQTEVMASMKTTISEIPVVDFQVPTPPKGITPPPAPFPVPSQPKAQIPNKPFAEIPMPVPPPSPPPRSAPLPPSPPIATPRPVSQGLERRTMVVDGPIPTTSKGKIIGWLISYMRNPDGEDFRVYSGYNRIGANPVCDIVVEDETVSGSHAIIVYREGRCLIKDDLSRNGTFVNGREITEAHPLQSYDEIRVGNTTMTYVAAQRT